MRALVWIIVTVVLAACEPKWQKFERLYGLGGIWENQNKLFIGSFTTVGNGSVPTYYLFSDSTLYNTCYVYPGYKYDSPILDIQCDNGDLYKIRKIGEGDRMQLKGPFKTPQEEADLLWETYAASSRREEDWMIPYL